MNATGYLLDTNVISELRKSRPSEKVAAFMKETDSTALFMSVLTLGELRKGVQMRRRIDPAMADLIGGWVDSIETVFADRLLPVDAKVARLWGEASAVRSLPAIDTLIAATALVHGLILVTRNIKDFKATGVSILDPWQ